MTGCRSYKIRRGRIVKRRGRVLQLPDVISVGGKRYTAATGRLPGGMSRALVCRKGSHLSVVGHGGYGYALRRLPKGRR